MLVVGLTGIIGSGKSTVAELLNRRGAAVIDVDRIGHAVLDEQSIKEELKREFGDDIIAQSGKVNRRKLGALVFEDKKKLDKLNALVHPKMIKIVEQKIGELKQSDIPYIVVEAALLFELGLQSHVDVSLTVTAPKEVCVERVRQRNHIARDQIVSRMKFQLSDQQKRHKADIVLENDCSLEELNHKVYKVHDWLLSQSGMNMS